MRTGVTTVLAFLCLAALGCKEHAVVVPVQDASIVSPAPVDANTAPVVQTCNAWGVPGECTSKEACTAGRSPYPYPGFCTSTTICCTKTPDLADNPPPPTGWKLIEQSKVTPEMTAWAIDVLHDVDTYPMYVTTTKQFGSLEVLAQLQWHPPDFNKEIVHRGVTLFEKD